MKIFLRKFFIFYLLLTSINSLDYDGYFRIISYNVGGLPEIISSSKPSKYTKLISPRLNKYDIVNVQEDFGYNDDLISLMEHEYRTEFSGNVPFGNGLMTFSKYPLFNYRRLKWKDTHGFIVDGADQMIPKGFTYNSVEIKPGFSIDIYNIHTDADTDEKSMACRRSNMAQLGEFIKNASAGKAVIVFGDTNSRYTREGDDFDKLVVNPCNLTDAWIQNIMKGEIPPKGPPRMVDDLGELGEVVDKIWFRSGKNIELNATTFKLHLTGWTDKDGKQLSDHYPITSNIGWRRCPSSTGRRCRSRRSGRSTNGGSRPRRAWYPARRCGRCCTYRAAYPWRGRGRSRRPARGSPPRAPCPARSGGWGRSWRRSRGRRPPAGAAGYRCYRRRSPGAAPGRFCSRRGPWRRRPGPSSRGSAPGSTASRGSPGSRWARGR